MGKSEPRKQINNFNPYNRLELNNFHQIQHNAPAHPKQGHNLHKKKRDLERLLKHREKKQLETAVEVVEQLTAVTSGLQQRKKDYERVKRKEFFIGSKYKQIMSIEHRKLKHQLHTLTADPHADPDAVLACRDHLNYVEHYPSNLKYVSLFPTAQPLSEQARQFQLKVMADIKEQLAKKQQKMNAYQPDNTVKKRKHTAKDDFFIEPEQGPEQGPEQEAEQSQSEGES